jgi:hypothetical protein
MTSYIVTTHRPTLVTYTPPKRHTEISRRVVATLDEALTEARASASSWSGEAHDQLHAIPKSGGTIGPLPDGTLIEVTPA